MATLAKSVNIRMMEVTEEDAVVLSKIAKIYYNAENDNNYFVYKQKSWQLLDVFNNESESLLQIIGKSKCNVNNAQTAADIKLTFLFLCDYSRKGDSERFGFCGIK